MGYNEGPYQNFTAGAAISARRFVKVSAAKTVIQGAAATDVIIGVAPEAIASGKIGRVLTIPGTITMVEVGTGGVTAGAPVTSDTVGKAVAWASVASPFQSDAGIALETRAAGEFAEILLNTPSTNHV